MSGFVIRLAAPEDAPAIADVLERSFVEHRSRYTPRGYQATVLGPDRVLERMREGPLWVAVRGGVEATAAAVVTGQGCYVRGMAVIPAARGLGIGWKLLETIERFARDERLSTLYLSTTPFLDRAIGLYERYGFRRAAFGPADLHGTALFTMVKRLAPAEAEGASQASPSG